MAKMIRASNYYWLFSIIMVLKLNSVNQYNPSFSLVPIMFILFPTRCRYCAEKIRGLETLTDTKFHQISNNFLFP